MQLALFVGRFILLIFMHNVYPKTQNEKRTFKHNRIFDYTAPFFLTFENILFITIISITRTLLTLNSLNNMKVYCHHNRYRIDRIVETFISLFLYLSVCVRHCHLKTLYRFCT